jgi:hypothetical protein
MTIKKKNSKAQGRCGSGTFRRVFDKLAHACIATCLVKGFAVDASIIETEALSKLTMPCDKHHVWQSPAHCKRAG